MNVLVFDGMSSTNNQLVLHGSLTTWIWKQADTDASADADAGAGVAQLIYMHNNSKLR